MPGSLGAVQDTVTVVGVGVAVTPVGLPGVPEVGTLLVTAWLLNDGASFDSLSWMAPVSSLLVGSV